MAIDTDKPEATTQETTIKESTTPEPTAAGKLWIQNEARQLHNYR